MKYIIVYIGQDGELDVINTLCQDHQKCAEAEMQLFIETTGPKQAALFQLEE